ncbi:Predicted transcriptional regulator with C-terminal CBS domains [uncultured Roseburia sp.]|uniref:CBS domain-containing protein n=1 Tax=Brotonthovivens ammoniilytica TaxID=2981725 RepID=A0ABT2TLL5_9FIRM|nr:CBS domain-containing protein [Brotonthovivens ammoniilytica]MCU6762716.1 CBS domain-containing protein [Brotonthovivens ammoniilytica]SCI85855.1 Predicted transcriptional regulator with C-terminal CBS domains [uncultured Roseburia sp.]
MNALMLLKNKDSVSYLYETDSIQTGLEELHRHGYTAIPVLTLEGTYAGSISEGDFLRHLVKHSGKGFSSNTQIREIMRANFNPAVRIDVEMEELLELSMKQNFIPVVDDRDFFIGIITRQDIIKAIVHAKN